MSRGREFWKSEAEQMDVFLLSRYPTDADGQIASAGSKQSLARAFLRMVREEGLSAAVRTALSYVKCRIRGERRWPGTSVFWT